MLAGKYRVERVLGSGGMGIVVSAVHTQLDQRVAIKFVRNEALGNQDAVQRFLREARAAVKLKSEHAARVIDVGTLESGAPYMVMEYLEGSDLGAVLEDHGALTVEAAAEWIVQACEAIAEAHAMGIVHRDIKPQNLFLTKTVGGQPKVKVLDFGVSKSMTSSGMSGLTQTRAMLGSPLYMSPEQMRSSRDVDARADVWALGVVLYELLTKRWPFEAESMPELCLKVVSEQPLPITAYRPDIPKTMIDVIACCLQKDPARRYANAAELASALEPVAPPASRAIAERARLAIGSSSNVALFGKVSVVPSSAISGPHPIPDVLANTALTPAAWDSNQGKSVVAGPKKPSRGRLIGIGGAVVAVAAIGFFALRSHPAESPLASSPPSAAVAPTSASVPPASEAILAPLVPSPAVASVDPAVASSSAIAMVPGPALPRTSPGAAVTPPANGGKLPPARASASSSASKPKPPDDDIPSLR